MSARENERRDVCCLTVCRSAACCGDCLPPGAERFISEEKNSKRVEQKRGASGEKVRFEVLLVVIQIGKLKRKRTQFLERDAEESRRERETLQDEAAGASGLLHVLSCISPASCSNIEQVCTQGRPAPPATASAFDLRRNSEQAAAATAAAGLVGRRRKREKVSAKQGSDRRSDAVLRRCAQCAPDDAEGRCRSVTGRTGSGSRG